MPMLPMFNYTAGEIETFFGAADLLSSLKLQLAGAPRLPNPPTHGDSILPPTPLNRGENVGTALADLLGTCFPV